jgi:hypothetical protein
LYATRKCRKFISTYRGCCVPLVAALAGDLEGDIIRGVALDLDRAGRQVVEVLVQELFR